jgi:hypothetical protein
MAERILTEVSAKVDSDREPELVAGFQELVAHPVPDGLLRTDLLRGNDGSWRIQTVWRDRDALEAMRAAPLPPAAPRLFGSVGAEPSLQIYEIIAEHVPEPPAA